jgi:hypothetical protein
MIRPDGRRTVAWKSSFRNRIDLRSFSRRAEIQRGWRNLTRKVWDITRPPDYDEVSHEGNGQGLFGEICDLNLDTSPDVDDFQQMLLATLNATHFVGRYFQTLHKVPERKARELRRPFSVRDGRGPKILSPQSTKGSVRTSYIHAVTDAGRRMENWIATPRVVRAGERKVPIVTSADASTASSACNGVVIMRWREVGKFSCRRSAISNARISVSYMANPSASISSA